MSVLSQICRLGVAPGLLVLVGCVAEPVAPPSFADTALDAYGLAVEPDPAVFGQLLDLDLAPIVMVELLRFRDQAEARGSRG